MGRRFRDVRWNERRINAFCSALQCDHRAHVNGTFWGKSPGAVRRSLLACLPDADYELLCKVVLCHSSDREKTADLMAIGNKFPPYSLFLPELHAVLPNAKFLLVVRDYRDNIVSYLKVPYEASSSAAFYAYRWKCYNRRVLSFMKRYPRTTMLVRYEDLVRSPEHLLRDVCFFLAVPYDEGMLHFHRHESRYERQESRLETLGGLRPVDEASLERYKRELTSEEVAQSQAICGRTGAELGYLPWDGASGVRGIGKGLGRASAMLYTGLEMLAAHLPLRIRFVLRLFNDIVEKSRLRDKKSGGSRSSR